MARNAALSPCRFGRPKQTFEAPQLVLTFSSSRRRRTRWKTAGRPSPCAPIGITQRIDHDVPRLDAVVRGALDDLLRDLEADVRVLGDAGLVVRDRDHRAVVLLDQRQDGLEPLLLARDRVDQRPALVGLEARPRAPPRSSCRSQSGRSVSDCTSWMVLARIAGSSASGMPALTSSIMAPACDLGQRVALDGREVAGRHLGRELLAPGRVDALADDAERPLEADDDGLRRRADRRSRSCLFLPALPARHVDGARASPACRPARPRPG